MTENCLDKFGKMVVQQSNSEHEESRNIEHLNTGLQQMSTKQRHGDNVADLSGHDHP